MKPWISRQHDGMIPKKAHRYSSFISIFRYLAKNMEDLTKQVDELVADTAPDNWATLRDRVKDLFKDRLLYAFHGTTDQERVPTTLYNQCHFLAYQWLADLEAVLKGSDNKLHDPFGDITLSSIVPGIGGDEGFRLLKTTGEQEGDWREKIESVMMIQHALVTNKVETGLLGIAGSYNKQEWGSSRSKGSSC